MLQTTYSKNIIASRHILPPAQLLPKNQIVSNAHRAGRQSLFLSPLVAHGAQIDSYVDLTGCQIYYF